MLRCVLIAGLALVAVVGINYGYAHLLTERAIAAGRRDKAADAIATEKRAFETIAKSHAIVDQEGIPPAKPNELGVKDIEGIGYLLADSSGNWVLVLHWSPCAGSESMVDHVGLFQYVTDYEEWDFNINLAHTRDGATYRNDEHLCMFLIPRVTTIEEFLRRDMGGKPWRRVSADGK
jgi:hypothetical protein